MREPKILEGWFSIATTDASDVKDRAQDRFGPRGEDSKEARNWVRKGFLDAEGNITDEGWRVIGEDARKMEENALRYLQKTLENASSEGHDDNRLVGSFEFNARNPDQTDLVLAGVEGSIESSNVDLDKICVAEHQPFWNGTS